MPPPTSFSPELKVVIDAVIFVAALIQTNDDRLPLVIDALNRALPPAHAKGQPELDKIIHAGAAISEAWCGRRTDAPNWRMDWTAANMNAASAVTSFAWWRLRLSYDAAFTQPDVSEDTAKTAEADR